MKIKKFNNFGNQNLTVTRSLVAHDNTESNCSLREEKH